MTNVINFYPKGYIPKSERPKVIKELQDDIETRLICVSTIAGIKLHQAKQEVAAYRQKFNPDF